VKKENDAHVIVANKGGIGKTLSASILTQYKRAAGITIEAVDGDPQSPKLSLIKELNAPLLPLIENGEIKQSAFDPTFSHIIHSENSTLIDTGSGAFLPILKYMRDNQLFDLLKQVNKQLYFHVIVISGPEKIHTAQGAAQLLDKIKGTGAKVVIWQNERNGIPTFNGKGVEETDWYQNNLDQIAGTVKIRDYNNSAFEADFLAMMEENLTYQEIMNGKSKTFDFMRQNRINRIFTDVYAELDAIFKPQSLCQ
jgi:hypothetical protein